MTYHNLYDNFDERFTIASFGYSYPNNQFNTTIEIITFDVHNGCILAVKNFTANTSGNIYNEFYIDVIQNKILTPDLCKWDQKQLFLLHKWIDINFINIMKIWHQYKFHFGDPTEDVFNILESFNLV